MAYERVEDREGVERLLGRNDLRDLKRRPGDDLRHASIQMREGQARQAMDFAYRSVCAREGQDSAQISGSYIAFVFHSPPVPCDEEPSSMVVGSAKYVKMTRLDSGDIVSGIVDAEDNLPWGSRLSSSDARIKAVAGRATGDVVDFSSTSGSTAQWRIDEVLPDYIRAARFLMAEHEDKFGPDAIIFRMIVQDDNLDPLLDQVRRSGAQADKTVENTLRNGLPLALGSREGGIGALKLGNTLRARGLSIPVNEGSGEAQQKASAAIESITGGVAVDLFTAVTAHRIGLLESVSQRYGPLYLAANEVDGLLAYIETLPRTGETGSLSTINGHIFRDMRDVEGTESVHTYFTGLIEALKAHLSLIHI